MKNKLQQEYEQQILLQQEIDKQVEEELKQAQALKEQSERILMSTRLCTSELEQEPLMRDPSFKKDDSSILSQDRSISDEYSSFMNDIRTVYELQDEDSKLIIFNNFQLSLKTMYKQ